MDQEKLSEIGRRLEASPISGRPHIKSAWAALQFKGLNNDWFDEDARLDADGAIIYLYPILDKYEPEYANYAILREFGNALLAKAPEDARTIWEQKLAIATPEQVDAFKAKLGQGYKSYAEVVDSITTPVDRLVATHLANAMLSNGQAYAGAENVDVRQWGPTAELANMTRFYSLAPLTSAYCPRTIHENFGSAFAASVLDLKFCRHSSVASALNQIVSRIADMAR